MRYADVIVDISHEKLDKVYQYAIPSEYEGVALVGSRVEISFGSRMIKGYIVNITDKPSFDPKRTKPISGMVDKEIGLDGRMIRLAYYIRQTYGATVNDALKTVIPVKKVVKNVEKKFIRLIADKETYNEQIRICSANKTFKTRLRMLNAYSDTKIISEELLVNKLNISKGVIKAMVDKNIFEIVSEVNYRNPVKVTNESAGKIDLNDEQRNVINTIINDYDSGVRKPYLIHGVTGSGKTEVYMEIIEHVVATGKQVIMLIPEIALTYQTVKRFYARFGNRVSIMNSRLSDGERYDQYLRAKNSDIDIIIGPRSALFTPFSNPGLIVIDEEHEGSYKSEMPPKYDARQVAMYLASLTGSSVILGSATPSITSYYKAMLGEYKLLELKNRAGNAGFPSVHVEDLREEIKEGNKSIFSRKLDSLMENRLNKGEQIMLFINRRGYSGFVSCRSCGHIIKCPHCDVSLTYHSPDGKNKNTYDNQGKMICHYCGYEVKAYDRCPKCSSGFISLFGTGTQKVEMLTKKRFPNARILRMDADTTSGKNGHADILSAFASHEADILIGTQMIVKGHDFPNVTLVGILAADLSLGSNDYNASENTFELLLQAAGRAGRADKPGEVVIQTYRPDHYSIVNAATGNYKNFYHEEILHRKLSGYPPVASMICVLIMSQKEESATALAKYLKKMASEYENNGVTVLGPSDAVVSKISDVYRKVIYLKSGNINELIGLRNKMQNFILDDRQFRDCNVQFDLNPMHCQ